VGGRHRTKPGTFALMCHAVINSPNLQRAILRCFQFYNLFIDDMQFRLQKRGEEAVVTLTFDHPEIDWDHSTADSCLVLLHRFFSWLIGQRPARYHQTGLGPGRPRGFAQFEGQGPVGDIGDPDAVLLSHRHHRQWPVVWTDERTDGWRVAPRRGALRQGQPREQPDRFPRRRELRDGGVIDPVRRAGR